MKNAQKKNTEMSLKLPPDLRDRLAREAKTRRTSASALVRAGIEVILGICPTCGGEHATAKGHRTRSAAA